VQNAAAAMPVETMNFGVLSTICLLLFIGATGKSAQIPLYVWLPDAMEGPTPVSALIHAATMVTAGVYMIARTAVLFSHAPLVMQIVGIVGALTALMAATIGLVQNDIKRVLAYSTVSQLGYMFLATGVGAFAAAVFHLVTHAFFKALLFLGSGSVIHAMAGEQDMQKMGGLRKYMPMTFVTMMLGALAIAGIPPLAGFFSKDEILYRAFLGNRLLWVVAAMTALLTAFYMFRLMLLTFYGVYRGPAGTRTASAAAAAQAANHGVRHPLDAHAHGHAHQDDHEVSHGKADAHGEHWLGPHESPAAMTFPLMVLAVGAIVAGFIGVPHVLHGNNAIEVFLEPSFSVAAAASHETTAASLRASGSAAALSSAAALGLMGLSVLLGVAGILTARHFYLRNPELPARLARKWHGLHSLVFNKFFVDELYDATAVRGTLASARGLFTFDRRVVDGAVNGSALLTQIASWLSHMTDKHIVDGAANLVAWSAGRGSFLVRRIQTGLVQNYALLMLLGLFAFLTVLLLAR
jgi:NADH-quinone oxidoreductase subunit L